MKVRTVYSFDESDGGQLHPERFSQSYNLVQASVDEFTRDAVESAISNMDGMRQRMSEVDMAGLKAKRRIAGNVFEYADVLAYHTFIKVLAKRHFATAEKVEREARALGKGGQQHRTMMTKAAAIRETANHAECLVDEFLIDFRNAANKDDASLLAALGADDMPPLGAPKLSS